MVSEPFDQLPALMRLSSESIYRLMHISEAANQWSEETLTEIRRGHLSGDHYRIETPCPVHKSTNCSNWRRSSVLDVAGGIRLTTTNTEEPIWGADILLVINDGAPSNATARAGIPTAQLPISERPPASAGDFPFGGRRLSAT